MDARDSGMVYKLRNGYHGLFSVTSKLSSMVINDSHDSAPRFAWHWFMPCSAISKICTRSYLYYNSVTVLFKPFLACCCAGMIEHVKAMLYQDQDPQVVANCLQLMVQVRHGID